MTRLPPGKFPDGTPRGPRQAQSIAAGNHAWCASSSIKILSRSLVDVKLHLSIDTFSGRLPHERLTVVSAELIAEGRKAKTFADAVEDDHRCWVR